MMRSLFTTVLAAVLLLAAPVSSWAFTLLSPPLRPATGTFLRCLIFNFASATKDMDVQITIVDRFGVETVFDLTGQCGLTSSDNRVSCSVITDDTDARVCRFDVKGVNNNDVRASIELLDASGSHLTALEAR